MTSGQVVVITASISAKKICPLWLSAIKRLLFACFSIYLPIYLSVSVSVFFFGSTTFSRWIENARRWQVTTVEKPIECQGLLSSNQRSIHWYSNRYWFGSPSDDRSICAMTWKIQRFSFKIRKVIDLLGVSPPIFSNQRWYSSQLSQLLVAISSFFIFPEHLARADISMHIPSGMGRIINFIAYSSCVFYSSVLAFCFSHFYTTASRGYLRHFEPKVARCKF